MGIEKLYRKIVGPPSEEATERRVRKIIEELREPLENILSELGDEIEKGAYGVLIGDDASGRIPTLMLGEIIKTLYARRGLPPPLIRFIAGSTGIYRYSEDTGEIWEKKMNAMTEQIARIRTDAEQQRQDSGKALIITEAIALGRSVDLLVTALKENNWDRDVATVGLERMSNVNSLGKRWNARVVAGMKGTPLLYKKKAGKELSGIYKERKELFSKTRVSSEKHNTPDLQSRINLAREVAKEVAQEIAEEYLHTQSIPNDTTSIPKQESSPATRSAETVRAQDIQKLSEIRQRLGISEERTS